MTSKNPTRQIHQVLTSSFDELDPDFLQQLSGELVAWLEKLQASGAPSKDVIQLRLRVKEIPWLAQELRRLRIEHKMRQSDVAAKMDMSTSSYMRREIGTGKFTFADVLFLLNFVYKTIDPALRAKLEQAARRKK